MRRAVFSEAAILVAVVAGLALAALAAQRFLFPRNPAETDLGRRIDAGLAPLVLDQVRATRSVMDDATVTAAFADIIARLEVAAPGMTPAPRVLVVRSPEANASTLPGGIICVNTGLIRIMDTPEEMAAVLAHELSHAAHRDPLSLLARQLGVSALASVLTGGRGSSTLSSIVQTLVNVRYGRDAENRADDFAVDDLAEAGVPPDSFAAALLRLRDEQPRLAGLLTWLDPHDPVDERIQRAQKRAASEKTRMLRPLGVDWAAVREVAGAT